MKLMKSQAFVGIGIFAFLVTSITATNNFYGITVANSVGNNGAYTCRTQVQWEEVVVTVKREGFTAIRILGFDCDALEKASIAAVNHGIKVMAGIFISGPVASATAQIDKDVEAFRAAYTKFGSKDIYVGLTIGNEVEDSVGAIMAKVYEVRGFLKSVGVNTPVSTVHTWVHIRDSPDLCGADFVGANAHAFYDGDRTSEQAGDFVFNTVRPALQSVCPGKKIYITESGWSSRGKAFGIAEASNENERNALYSLNCSFKDDKSVSVFAFEYDDQVWKGNDNERSFGIVGKVGLSSDIFNTFC